MSVPENGIGPERTPTDDAWAVGNAWVPPSNGIHPPGLSESVTGRRVAAGFLDLIPLVLIAVALSHRVETHPGMQFRLEGANFLVLVAVSIANYFVSESLTGTTAGKRLMGLTVIAEDGRRPPTVAILQRTALRIVDALPVFYLVGFICVLVTPDNRRLGDMVAQTRVVSLQTASRIAERTGAARSGVRAAFLAIIAVATLMAGIIGTTARIGETPASDRLGRFEVDRDMEPKIREVVTALKTPTADRIEALFADGVTSADRIETWLQELGETFGRPTGKYRIDGHRKVVGAELPGLGRQNVMQFKLTAEFEKSTQPVLITFAVLERQLEMVGCVVAIG